MVYGARLESVSLSVYSLVTARDPPASATGRLAELLRAGRVKSSASARIYATVIWDITVSASGRRLSPRWSFPLPFPTDVPKIAADGALFALS